MWRWVPCIVLFVLGVGALGFGVHTELTVQYEVGNWERTANWLYGEDIRYYRGLVTYCWIGGPILLLLAYLVRPGSQRES